MDALTYIATKWSLTLSQRSPIEIPNTNRETLARLFYLLGHTTGVEVGTERGEYADCLLRGNPLLALRCVDLWKSYAGYRDHVNQRNLDRFYAEAQARLAPYGSRGVLIRQWAVEAAQGFKDGSLDFVYLDAAHDLPSVIADLKAWTPKVRAGGIIAGHDYCKHRWPNQMHVPQAIHAWVDS